MTRLLNAVPSELCADGSDETADSISRSVEEENPFRKAPAQDNVGLEKEMDRIELVGREERREAETRREFEQAQSEQRHQSELRALETLRDTERAAGERIRDSQFAQIRMEKENEELRNRMAKEREVPEVEKQRASEAVEMLLTIHRRE